MPTRGGRHTPTLGPGSRPGSSLARSHDDDELVLYRLVHKRVSARSQGVCVGVGGCMCGVSLCAVGACEAHGVPVQLVIGSKLSCISRIMFSWSCSSNLLVNNY